MFFGILPELEHKLIGEKQLQVAQKRRDQKWGALIQIVLCSVLSIIKRITSFILEITSCSLFLSHWFILNDGVSIGSLHLIKNIFLDGVTLPIASSRVAGALMNNA